MSEKLTFLHDSKHTSIVNGKKEVHEEFVIHGPKGLTIKYFHKDDETSKKIIVAEKDDKFVIVTMDGDKKEESEIAKSDLSKVLAKHKELKFAVDYVKKMKGGKKASKKGSKKATKKTTKKSTKKGTKKTKKN